MEHLIRDRIHAALDIEPVPAYLRSRVIDSMPVSDGAVVRQGRKTFRLALGTVAAMLAIALIAAAMYAGGLWRYLNHPVPVTHPPTSVLSPEGMAIGSDGSVYVADYSAGYVFKVGADGGLVTIAAGLHHPAGLVVDRSGDVFVAEAFGNRVLRIDPAGHITTYAGIGPNGFNQGAYAGDGGRATAASLNYPVGLALDRSGNLYIGDLNNNAVRRVDAATGVITTLAIPTSVFLAYPGYLAFDQAGDLYVASHVPYPAFYGNCTLVRMDTLGRWSAIAGTNRCGYSGDGGPATSAELSMLGGMAFDSAGNLYFADSDNGRIRRIDKHGIVTTVAGTGTSGFNGDGPATARQLGFPYGIAMSRGGLLYISDGNCGCDPPSTPGHVRVLNIATGLITTLN